MWVEAQWDSCDGAQAMANETQTVRRTVQFKFTLPAANSSQLAAMMRSAAPFYEAFGGRRMRLLQNVDDPARFVQEIEYDTHEVVRAQPPARRQRPSGPGLSADLALVLPGVGRNRRLSGGGIGRFDLSRLALDVLR